MTKKPFAWSYSRLTGYETCPWRHYLTQVSKEVIEPQTEATDWGNRVHKALELRLGGKPLADTMKQFEPHAAAVMSKGGKVEAEKQLAISSSFKPTGWFAKGRDAAWCRVITDFTIHKGDKMFVGDWKTGKPTPASMQLAVAAAVTFAHHPYVREITTGFVWLKAGVNAPPTTARFTREDVPAIWQRMMPRVQAMEQAYIENKWPKRPSGLCRQWCPVPHEKCEFRGG